MVIHGWWPFARESRQPGVATGFVRWVRSERLGNDTRRLKRVGDVRLLLLHEDGETWIVDARCPHMGASLRRANVDGGRLWCPKHGYCFRLSTGTRLSPPPGSDGGGGLQRYRHALRDGWIGVLTTLDGRGRRRPLAWSEPSDDSVAE